MCLAHNTTKVGSFHQVATSEDIVTSQRQYESIGVVALFVAAFAVHWLITPTNHPSASGARVAGVLAQLVVATAVTVWAWRRSKAAKQSV